MTTQPETTGFESVAEVAAIIGSVSETGHVYVKGNDACGAAAAAILASDWFREQIVAAQAEAAERIAQAIERTVDDTPPAEHGTKWNIRVEEAAAIARAALVAPAREGEDEYRCATCKTPADDCLGDAENCCSGCRHAPAREGEAS